MSALHQCPTCGHPVVPATWPDGLTATERAIFDKILRAGAAGLSRQALADRVRPSLPHGAHRDPKSITEHIRRLKKKIGHSGLAIERTRSSEAVYRVRAT